MQSNYYIKNMVERISRGDFTYFLTENEYQDILPILHKEGLSYQVYKPYGEAEKVILYKAKVPKVKVYKIECSKPLTHSKILGTLFSLGIHSYFFGDIVMGEEIYIVILTSIEEHFLDHFTKIGKDPIHLTQVKFSEIAHYTRTYSDIYVKVPSLRMDAILSKLLRKSRTSMEELLGNKEVTCNGMIVMKGHLLLHSGDVFSVRGYGKYRYRGEIIGTKGYTIHLEKYM